MSNLYQPGQHPDADTLSAFADQALPPHEQQQTLAHLATCPGCRNFVYLAQQADPVEVMQPYPTEPSHPWFFVRKLTGWNLAWPAAALAGLVFLTIHLHHTNTTASTTTASVDKAPALPAAPAATLSTPAATSAPQPITAPQQKPLHTFARTEMQSQSLPEGKATEIAATDQVTLAPPPPAPTAALGALTLTRNLTSDGGSIHGTITDPSGAFIPRAKITATNTDTGVFVTRETNAAGDFALPPLQPGNYTVEAIAPGFQRLLQQNVQVQPLQQLAVNMKLNIGATSETVTVTDAPPSLDTTNATLGGTIENELYTQLPLAMTGAPKTPAVNQFAAAQIPQTIPPTVPPPPPPSTLTQGIYGGTGQTNLNENYVEGVPVAGAGRGAQPATPVRVANASAMNSLSSLSNQTHMAARQPTLPSHLPALSTITNTRHTVALDTAGALFRSEDAGVTWLPVPAQWSGRAVHLALVPTGAVAKAKVSAAEPQPQRDTPSPMFQLTTDTGITYTSPDGQTWHRK